MLKTYNLPLDLRSLIVTKTDKIYSGVNRGLYVYIHETDNTSPGADADAHARLQYSNQVREASWHLQVDDHEAIQSFPLRAQCWHGGDKRGPANLDGIAIEICVNSDGNYELAFRNAAMLAAAVLTQLGRTVSDLRQHYDSTKKNCPRKMRAAKRWTEFKNLVQAFMDYIQDPSKGLPKGHNPSTSKPPTASPPESGATVRMHSPIKNGRVTSEYGKRGSATHAGIDIAPATKTRAPVYASFAGVIEKVTRGRKPGDKSRTNELAPYRTGNGPIVRNPDGEAQLYGHVEVLPSLGVGDRVAAGQLLGYTDLSGNTTGHHVHYEEWLSGSKISSPRTRNPRVSFSHFKVTPGADTGQGKESTPPATSDPVDPSPPIATPPATAPSTPPSGTSPAHLAWQERQNKYGKAGLFEDGLDGPVSARWREWVKSLQSALNHWKAVQRTTGALLVDGDYGSTTDRAVRAVQEANPKTFGVADGVVGPKTVKALGISAKPSGR